jgi:intein/homing endonuclease
VQTPNGLSPIEQIKVGDLVYSFGENRAISVSPVIGIYSRAGSPHYLIIAGDFEVNATSEHPFLTPDGYKRAASLAAGDIVFVYREGALFPQQVSSVSFVAEPATVYNLQVDNQHTFIANGFAVHNKPPVAP